MLKHHETWGVDVQQLHTDTTILKQFGISSLAGKHKTVEWGGNYPGKMADRVQFMIE